METKMTEETTHCVGVCNSLLRGEMSAVETYDKAIEKYAEEEVVSDLMRIRDEHRVSADHLRKNVQSMGGEPDESSGAWGSFANTVQSTANLFGENSAIFSLKLGEEHGKGSYESALADEGVMEACKALMRTELLPRVNTHIQTLERLSDSS